MPKAIDVMTNSIGMKLVWMPTSTFQMGSNNGYDNEKPVHSVNLTKGFWVGQYDVTQEEYQKVIGNNPSNFKGSCNPVDQVSINDAVKFCTKLSQKEGKIYALPTEAQWEYACRAGSNANYCFGDTEGQLDDYAWYRGNSSGKTHPVGQKKPNAFGLYDMHGNVWEYCLDWYEEGFYGRNMNADPLNKNYGDKKFRILRGGSWTDLNFHCRSANRSIYVPGYTSYSIGFRVLIVSDGL